MILADCGDDLLITLFFNIIGRYAQAFKTSAINRSANPPCFATRQQSSPYASIGYRQVGLAEPPVRILPVFEWLASVRISPAVGCFVDADALQAKLVAERGLIDGVENGEGDASEVLSRRHGIEDNSLVPGHRVQESQHWRIATIDQKSMIPSVDHVRPGQLLDAGKVHEHAILRDAGRANRRARQRDLDGIPMAMQMAALACMVGNAMAGVELEAAGYLHGGGHTVKSCGIISAGQDQSGSTNHDA